MCSFASIDQNRPYPPFEPSIESSFSSYAPYGDLEKEEFFDSPFFLPLRATITLPEDKGGYESFAAALVQKNGMQTPPPSASIIREQRRPEASFQFHREYIKKRLKQSASESVSTRQLFEAIQANGYLGSYSTVATFVSLLRGKQGPEESFRFHREYIKKRLKQSASESVSTRELFKEIKAKGYQGTLKTVQAFVSMIRTSKPPEASLEFHKEYIRKRLEEAAFGSVSTKELLEEIKAKGYQGTLRTVQTFVSMIRTSRPPKVSLEFHNEYITKRLGKVASESISIRQLFKEIQARGYLGSYDTVRKFVPRIGKKKNKRVEESFQFHKEYITKRLGEAGPEFISIRKLFEEIKANGYLGAYNTVRAFVSTIREKTKKKAEASFHFHKGYVKKRVEEAALKSVSIKELFEEIKAKGYQGAPSTVHTFVSTIRTSRAPEASLQFHKKYIRKRLGASKYVTTKQIFEEIKANGYAGAYGTARSFVSTIRTSSPPEASLQFHKEYIRKRLGESEYVPTKQIFEEIKANGYAGAYGTARSFVSTVRKT